MSFSFLVLFGCASGAPSLWPHPMRDGVNGRPGAYANYDFDQREASPDMEMEIIWTTIPPATDTDGNGVFGSSQFWHEAAGSGGAGYMGSQVAREGAGPFVKEKRQFIFSCWDFDDARRVSWDSDTNNCKRFGGEGVGSHCVLEFPIQVGVQYNFRYAMTKHDAAGAHWTGTVLDTSTGQTYVVGTLVYPDVDGYAGFGNLQFHSDDFLEYFGGGDCEGAVTTGVGIRGPYFHGKTSTPSQAYPSYNSADDCQRSVVHGCIPGTNMCDWPNVHLGGGKGVVRDTSDGQALWIGSGSGDVIRPSIAGDLCFDLPGGDTSNGNRLWLWSCNGMANQDWNWVDGAIHPGGDSSKCLDVPYSDFSNGNFIEIWDCNGAPGQNFGYDSDMQTIYLGSSMSLDASMCVDVAGGQGYDGANVQIWSCNGLPNQQWWLGSGDHSRVAVV